MIISIADKPSHIQYPPHFLPPSKKKKGAGLFTIRGFSILFYFVYFFLL